MGEKSVLRTVNNIGVATLTLNRPKVFNGYNEDLLSRFQATIKELEADSAVRIIVIRGAGKHFSAGADINWFKRLSRRSRREQLSAALLSVDTMQMLDKCVKPTIALIHNCCFGGGTGYAASCDIVIASEDAKFSISEVKIGITPAPIINQLINSIGIRQTRRYAVTGEIFDVYKAKEIGLVHDICPIGDLDVALKPIVQALLKAGPNAIRETKALVSKNSRAESSELDREVLANIGMDGRSSKEGIEGLNSFLEKRLPNWYPGDE